MMQALYLILTIIAAVYVILTLLCFTTMAIFTRTSMFYLGRKPPSLWSLLRIAASWPLWPWQKDEDEAR